MKSADLNDRMTSIFREVFDDDSLVLSPELSADDIDDWDSLSHIRLIVSHEKEFGVKFKTTEIGDIRNVGGLIDLLKSKLG
jgi:acyl carrier protein